ncbi:MAG: WYL domain-containing protein [Campylobacterota bacterium]|nr:WYL domain-containing protein [Campylobacterota bacterium]
MKNHKIEINFETIKQAFDQLLIDGELSSEKFKGMLQYTGKSTSSIDKDQQRAFKAIELMYNFQIDSLIKSNELILKKRGYLLFNSQGYRLFLSNNKKIAKRDLVLRYQYVISKDELIKEHLLSLIINNIEDSLTAIDSFKRIEKEPTVKKINEAILEDKQIKIFTENHEHIVNPLKLYYDNGFCYLAALKEDERTWWINIINSIKSLEILHSNITYSRDILNKYRKLQFDAFGDENKEREYRIILELVDECQYNYFKNKRYKVTQRLAPEEGKLCVEFKFNYIWEIQPLILGWLDVVTIKKIEYIKKDATYDEKLEKEQEFYKKIAENMNEFIDKNLKTT